MKKASRTISGVGLGLGMTAVGFATWGVLSTGTASASTAEHAAVTSTVAPTAPAAVPTTPAVVPTSPTMTPTVVPTAPVTTAPTAPPATGGGGTAGLQDAVLFGIGGAALLVGSGSVAYRLKGNKQS